LRIKYAIFLIALLIAGACAPTAEIAEEEPEPEEEVVEAPAYSEVLAGLNMDRLRSSFSDPYSRFQNEIPDVFQLTDEDMRAVNSNTGYRIQLISTESKSEADSVSAAYYDWIFSNEDTDFTQIPEAYVVFRQPYYRVRVGDFRSRRQAIDYLQQLRRNFQGAWVVFDTIDPERAN